ISPLFGFTYSPTGMFFDNYISYVFLILMFISATYLALKNLNNVRFAVFDQPKNSYVESAMSFSGMSPFMAILSRSLSFLEFAARFNYMGSSTFKTARIKIYKVIAVSTIIAIAYYIASKYVPFSLISFYVPLAEIIALFNLAYSTFSSDPLWLSLGIMEPARYADYYLIGKAISTFLIFLPIAIASLFIPRGIGIGISMMIGVPSAFIYLSAIQARVNPFQVKDENMPGFTYTLDQYIVAILSFPVWILLFVPAFLPTIETSIISGLIMLFLALPFLFMKKFWIEVEEKMVERGFD
ncbi:hypothetical protein, partial [Acidianus sp. RZ1]|uniref:hypothetical protein n=1 Tax=Acidianus sp. RZ1 TaxID=1540082 RepID=UPI001491A9FF